MDYLRDIQPSVYMRGLQKVAQAEPEFYTQLSFSGCAGEAETSAAAAAHWAALWYAKEHDRVTADLLQPAGFTPDPCAPRDAEAALFLPAGEFGHLEYTPPEDRRGPMPAFEMDNALAEALEGHEILERLDEAFDAYMEQRHCRCQLCEPEFGDAIPRVA